MSHYDTSEIYSGAANTVKYSSDTTDRVSGTNWTTTRCSLRPYKTADGSWFLKFNISGTVDPAVSTIDLAVAGVTFKNVSGARNAIDVATNSQTAVCTGYSEVNTSNLSIGVSSGTRGTWYMSGDVELDSKPTWL